jgi:hypothetical protein
MIEQLARRRVMPWARLRPDAHTVEVLRDPTPRLSIRRNGTQASPPWNGQNQ